MAFYGYQGDIDDYNWTPYSTTNHDYASTLIQSSFQFPSSCEFGELQSFDYVSSSNFYSNESYSTPLELSIDNYTQQPEIMQYDPIEFHNYYDESSVNQTEINHSVYSYSEIKLLQYEPPPYNRVYFPSCETKFTISYSAVEFNEPDYEEYDPTPYGGGYDPVTTYGKPLPPSDKTCYPRSVPKSNGIDSFANFSYGSIPSPYGKDNDDPLSKNLNGLKPIDTKIEPDNFVKNVDDEVGGNGVGGEIVAIPSMNLNGLKPIDVKTDRENSVENRDDGNVGGIGVGGEIVEQSEVIPSDDYTSSKSENEIENGRRGDYGYESYDRPMHQFSYGSGLETLDLCESIFGHWPCLAKIEQQQQQRDKCNEVWDQERRDEPWKTAADYLFGNPDVCNYENYYR